MPTAWLAHRPVVFRPEELDLTMERLDHLPVAVRVTLPAAGGVRWHQRKQVACDVAALARSEVKERLSRLVEALPPVEW
eukprot:8817984-Alexandrium_andersonii.AAC.1